MGYDPGRDWVAAQANLSVRAATLTPQRRVCEALRLAIDRAIGELEWKMRRSPEFNDSGSLTRVLHDLHAVREGLPLLTREKRARR